MVVQESHGDKASLLVEDCYQSWAILETRAIQPTLPTGPTPINSTECRFYTSTRRKSLSGHMRAFSSLIRALSAVSLLQVWGRTWLKTFMNNLLAIFCLHFTRSFWEGEPIVTAPGPIFASDQILCVSVVEIVDNGQSRQCSLHSESYPRTIQCTIKVWSYRNYSQIFYMVNIDVPAGVGAHPLDTQLLSTYKLHLDRSVVYCSSWTIGPQ